MIRTSRLIVGGMLALVGGAAVLQAVEPLVLFAPERAPLPVYVAADAAPEERAAAAELVRLTCALAGRPAAAVLTETAGPGAPAGGVFVGRTRAAAENAPALRAATDWFAPQEGEVAPDTIRLSAAGGRLFVEAATPDATEFAVAWLVQQYAGVRWIWPGADGEIVPRRDRWEIPGDLRETRAPAYVSREMFLGDTPDDATWLRRHGFRARVEFGHALNRVFTAREADAHPEWFAQVRGERLRPRSAADHHWQPNLARAEVAEFAAAQAREAFAAEPARRSFSLGMNDTVRFDQEPETRALVEPLRWFRGMPDYSPLVFTFMNRAAEALDRAGVPRDRSLGCLAYFWCENAPAFPVHPRVVPFVTTDRSQFFAPAYRAAELDLLARWGRAGVRTFGLWDYAYGGGFVVPRQPLQALADGVREGHHVGARAYFADASSPEWGFDAFKLATLARLLWEPERSVEACADDFFPAAYGPAAPTMREFFARAERQWMGQGGAAYWLKLYQHEDQALLFPPDVCRELRAELEKAERAVADDPVRRARVARTALAWARTEAFLDFDRVRRALAAASFETGRPAALGEFAAAGAGAGDLTAAEQRLAGALITLQQSRARFDATPALTSAAMFTRNDPVPRLLTELTWRDAAGPRRVLARVAQSAAVPAEWQALADVLAAGRLGGAKDVARNGSFASAAPGGQAPEFLFPRGGELPAEWEWRAVAAERQRVALLAADGRRPRRNVRFEGAWDSQLFQWNPAIAGRLYVATARARGTASPGSDAGLFLSFLDATGAPIGVHRMQTLPRGATAEWTNLVLADVAPAGTAWVGVGLATSRQVGDDWFEAGGVELRETDAKPGPPR